MKTQNPIIGRFKGSAGGMTGCKVFDKNVLRAKAFEVSNPKTQAQTTQRDYFKSLSALVATFSEEQLRELFGQKPKSKSRRNALSQQLAEYYDINGVDKTIKYSDIITLGNARMMNFGTTSCTISSGTVSVELDAAVKANNDVKNYRFISAIVNETKGEIIMPVTNNKVETGTLSISAPSTWENTDTVHAIPLITNALYDASAIGGFIIKVRPEKPKK